MNFHITLSPEQFEFLDGLLGDVVQLYEHQAAALACLDGEAARDLAQESEAALEDRVSRVEPALVLVCSILVGLILLSVMLPLMHIMAAIG